MREMIQTERDYVKSLEYVIEVRLLATTVISLNKGGNKTTHQTIFLKS